MSSQIINAFVGPTFASLFGPQPDAEADMADEAVYGICVATGDQPWPETWQLGDDDIQFCTEHGMYHSMELRDPTCMFEVKP